MWAARTCLRGLHLPCESRSEGYYEYYQELSSYTQTHRSHSIKASAAAPTLGLVISVRVTSSKVGQSFHWQVKPGIIRTLKVLTWFSHNDIIRITLRSIPSRQKHQQHQLQGPEEEGWPSEEHLHTTPAGLLKSLSPSEWLPLTPSSVSWTTST
jgi:hypothetical protein